MAGTDCGFDTFAGFGAVDADIVYAKITAMAEGADIASRIHWAWRDMYCTPQRLRSVLLTSTLC